MNHTVNNELDRELQELFVRFDNNSSVTFDDILANSKNEPKRKINPIAKAYNTLCGWLLTLRIRGDMK